jgi:L-threonylcarbamoyladenylate synthase
MANQITRIIRVDADNPSDALLLPAAVALRQGQLVAFPTETVYGLGANALDTVAVASIFEVKGRPGDNPLIVHIASLADLTPLVRLISPLAGKLFQAFAPGRTGYGRCAHPGAPGRQAPDRTGRRSGGCPVG